MIDVHVDRDEEMGLFERMASTDGDLHMLLIRAETGMGKSTLLSAFWAACEGATRAQIDFKGTALNVKQTLKQLARQLDAQGFARLNRALDEREDGPQVVFERAIFLGSKTSVTLPSGGAERRGPMDPGHLASLFVRELEEMNRHARPVILMLDTFEQATQEVRQWVAGSLVWEVIQHRWLALVIAGQTTPQLPPHKCWTERILQRLGFRDFQDYVRRLDLKLSDETIQAIYAISDGFPMTVGMHIDRLWENRDKLGAGWPTR